MHELVFVRFMQRVRHRGDKVRALFDRNDLPRREQAIRNTIKREGFWLR